MPIKKSDTQNLRKELDYYKQKLDELAGENVKLDYAISGLRHELKQKREGFALLRHPTALDDLYERLTLIRRRFPAKCQR